MKVEDEMIQNVMEMETVTPSDSSISATGEEGPPAQAQDQETTCWSIVTSMRDELSLFVQGLWDHSTEETSLTPSNANTSTRATAGQRQNGGTFGDVLQDFFFPSSS